VRHSLTLVIPVSGQENTLVFMCVPSDSQISSDYFVKNINRLEFPVAMQCFHCEARIYGHCLEYFPIPVAVRPNT
jgi:hypothetical protein